VFLIGLCGKVGAVKTTVGKELKEMLPNAVLMSYAAPLKQMTLYLMGLDSGQGWRLKSEDLVRSSDWIKRSDAAWIEPGAKDVKKRLDEMLYHHDLLPSVDEEVKTLGEILQLPLGQAYRRALQYLGTDVFRKRDPEFWLRKFSDRVQNARCEYVIVDDLRFPNEAERLRELGEAVILRIVPFSSNTVELDDSQAARHSSETSVDDIRTDAVFINAFSRLGGKPVAAAIVDMVRGFAGSEVLGNGYAYCGCQKTA